MKKKSKVKSGGVLVIPKNTLYCDAWKDLPPNARLVFIALMTEWWRDKDTNPDNEVTISQLKIGELTGLSTTTIWRGTKALKKAGFLEIKPEHQGGLERNTNTYTLNGRYLF
jgi:hypothetical protein